jgi:carbonic anhydrase
MEKIIRGLHEFQNNVFSSNRELFERLANGQKPEALFITCSDSRVLPNLITQTKPGELFILRNAGNIIPPYGAANGGEGATIEYAVTALGIKDIIICGHTHCGAMQGLHQQDKLTHMPSVLNWLQHAEATRRIIQDKYQEEQEEDMILDTIKENVLVQLENLRTHPCVAAGIAKNTLKLHGWVYHIETGEVFAYDPNLRKFQRIEEAPKVPADHLSNKAGKMTAI